MLAHEISLLLAVNPGEVDCALAFDEANHLGHRVFGRDRKHHMHVIGHQMPLLDLRFLLRREPMKHLAEIAAKLEIQCLAAAFRNKDNVIFAVPDRVA